MFCCGTIAAVPQRCQDVCIRKEVSTSLLERLLRRLGLITVPPSVQPTFVTWDYV